MLHAVIMAGGSGTRFWPASRADRPKQLLDFGLGQTLLQAAVRRLGDLVEPKHTLVITNQRLVKATCSSLPELPKANVIGEPCRRDTAPCIGLAAALVMQDDPDAIMLVTPADHVITSDEQFQSAVRRAVALVEQDPSRIVTFGIRPTYPASTFGYIERQQSPLDLTAPVAYAVDHFREKPSRPIAESYLASGNFYWNAGIFVWKAATIWSALAEYEPDIHAGLNEIRRTIGTQQFAKSFEQEFAGIGGKSIDFAVMERYPNVVVIEAPFAWDDLGNWPALARTRGVDEQGNTVLGKHLGLETRGCVISTDPNHLIATLGVNDLIIVHTPDATLVANRKDEESMRELVKRMETLGWKEYL
jgi:mannose-1-phosphate guanylyltransferase